MNVLIVESKAKSETLQKYLGKGWQVVATGGHIRTLPKNGNAYWASPAGALPDPPWQWTERGEKAVQAIRKAGGTNPVFWIATDPDREGELIAWHLERELAEDGPMRRVTFQEITKPAVLNALERPRATDLPLVESALVRGFLDRLVGFRTSKLAKSFIGQHASMGRVQTPTLGFVVERELERERFRPTPFFEVRAQAEGVALKVRFHEQGEPNRWRDSTGSTDLHRTFDGTLARHAVERLLGAGCITLSAVQAKTSSLSSRPAFTTDSLLQDAGSRFGWSAKKTSRLAAKLYEAGQITYIRTDSTRLADSAVAAARAAITKAFGADHLLEADARQQPPSGRIQDAHEAIRPSQLEVAEAQIDDADARRLYQLIRARTLASLMRPSQTALRRIEARCPDLELPLTGSLSWRTFLGWEAAYRALDTPKPTAPPDLELSEGAVWRLDETEDGVDNPRLIEDETKPPGRYRSHSLIKAMKEAGIGRPSTYASTLETLEERKYVEIESGAVKPTERGRRVWIEVAPLYASGASAETDEGGEELFSTAFTAQMEDGLDQVASGDVAAPERWVTWRDEIRALHEQARARREAGASTLRQQEQLRRLIAAVPQDASIPDIPSDLAELSYPDAQLLINQLHDAGVEPTPSQAQRDFIAQLLDELAVPEDERQVVLGVETIAEINTASQASAVIEQLKAMHDERRPPSVKQRRLIDRLRQQAGLSETETAALAGLDSLDALTGGYGGSASTLIDQLKTKTKNHGA